MFWFIVILVIAGVVAYKYRVQLLARILGQPQSRVERRLNQRKD
jgi:hypothetical protein